MRQIVTKYEGDCTHCGEVLEVGQPAMYERQTGIFCPGHEPTDPEEIRAYRQEKADAKADRLEGWATKRTAAATAVLDHDREHYRGDIAFNTQPGHIPLRARVIARGDRAHESLQKAAGMQDRADRLRRGVRVKGDAERRHNAEREYKRERLEAGMVVESVFTGSVEIVRVNRKTARVKGGVGGRLGADRQITEDLLYLSLPKEAT